MKFLKLALAVVALAGALELLTRPKVDAQTVPT